MTRTTTRAATPAMTTPLSRPLSASASASWSLTTGPIFVSPVGATGSIDAAAASAVIDGVGVAAGAGAGVGVTAAAGSPPTVVAPVAVNERTPSSGCPSAEVTRQVTVYAPAGSEPVTSWLTVTPSSTASPVLTVVPSGAVTTTSVPSDPAGSLNVSVPRAGAAATVAPSAGSVETSVLWACAAPAPTSTAAAATARTTTARRRAVAALTDTIITRPAGRTDRISTRSGLRGQDEPCQTLGIVSSRTELWTFTGNRRVFRLPRSPEPDGSSPASQPSVPAHPREAPVSQTSRSSLPPA